MNFAPKWMRWQSAELAAQSAEHSLREHLMASARGARSPDMAAEHAPVRDQRQHVHALFVEATDEMASTARALRCERPSAHEIAAPGGPGFTLGPHPLGGGALTR